jgi:hypothetical protein
MILSKDEWITTAEIISTPVIYIILAIAIWLS